MQLRSEVGTFSVGVPIREMCLDCPPVAASPARLADHAADAATSAGRGTPRMSRRASGRDRLLDGGWRPGRLPGDLGDPISPRLTEGRHGQRLGVDPASFAIRFTSASARRTCLPWQPLRRPGR